MQGVPTRPGAPRYSPELLTAACQDVARGVAAFGVAVWCVAVAAVVLAATGAARDEWRWALVVPSRQDDIVLGARVTDTAGVALTAVVLAVPVVVSVLAWRRARRRPEPRLSAGTLLGGALTVAAAISVPGGLLTSALTGSDLATGWASLPQGLLFPETIAAGGLVVAAVGLRCLRLTRRDEPASPDRVTPTAP